MPYVERWSFKIRCLAANSLVPDKAHTARATTTETQPDHPDGLKSWALLGPDSNSKLPTANGRRAFPCSLRFLHLLEERLGVVGGVVPQRLQ